MTFLSKVEDVFEISGRGCVLTPGLDETTPPQIELKQFDAIELRRPDGSIIQTRIESVDIIDKLNRQWCVPIILPPSFSKADIPIGTEIWLVNQ